MTTTTDPEFDIVPPDAAALVESLRAYGYTLNTAISDLIDNSISAKATSIWIEMNWRGKQSTISIADNGNGMSESQLVSAMRPGSMNPLAERSAEDLGRFGLGLKTASFSQCRSLTVASRTKSTGIAVRQWDLDYIGRCKDWRLLRAGSPNAEEAIAQLAKMPHGTVVFLDKLDKLVRRFTDR